MCDRTAGPAAIYVCNTPRAFEQADRRPASFATLRCRLSERRYLTAAMPASPSKAVYVKSKVAVANGVEQTNPEERAIVASAQYRIQSSTKLSASSRLTLPIHLFVTLKRMLTKGEYTAPSLRIKPAMILPFLLLGSEYNAAKYDDLYSVGVTHICNLDFASRNYFEGKFVYIKLNVMDKAEERLTPHFEGVNQFLESCEAIGGRVLVHCASGNALAPAFVVAFLMAKKGKSLDEALQFVRSKRPTTQLYPAFMDQLKSYEVRGSEARTE